MDDSKNDLNERRDLKPNPKNPNIQRHAASTKNRFECTSTLQIAFPFDFGECCYSMSFVLLFVVDAQCHGTTSLLR